MTKCTVIAVVFAALATLPAFGKECNQSTLSQALRTCDWESVVHLEVVEKENPPDLADIDPAADAAFVDGQFTRGKTDPVARAKSATIRLVKGETSTLTFAMKWKGVGGLAAAISRNRRGTHQLMVQGAFDEEEKILVGQWNDNVEVLGAPAGRIEVKFFTHDNQWYGVARWRTEIRDVRISKIERGWCFRVKS